MTNHTLREADKQLNAPREIGQWAWSFEEGGDSGEWNGQIAYRTRDDALQAALDDFEDENVELGETVNRDVYLIRFAWVDKEANERLILQRDIDEVSYTNEDYPPHHVKGCY